MYTKFSWVPRPRLVVYSPHVVDEVLLPGEALGAVGAGVGHVPGVLAHVVVQVLLARERARAERALVWRFTRVLSAQQSTFRFVRYDTASRQ